MYSGGNQGGGRPNNPSQQGRPQQGGQFQRQQGSAPYSDAAAAIIADIKKEQDCVKKGELYANWVVTDRGLSFTKTQIRQILSNVMVLNNKLTAAQAGFAEAPLPEKFPNDLLYFKARLLYQAAKLKEKNRSIDIRFFKQLADEVDDIIAKGTVGAFYEYTRLIESLIAYTTYNAANR